MDLSSCDTALGKVGREARAVVRADKVIARVFVGGDGARLEEVEESGLGRLGSAAEGWRRRHGAWSGWGFGERRLGHRREE